MVRVVSLCLGLAFLQLAAAGGVTPIQQVLNMMNDMKAKGQAELEDEQKVFAGYEEWFDDEKRKLGFEIELGRRYWEVEVLNAGNLRGIVVGLARKESALPRQIRWPSGWGIVLDDGMVVHNGNFSLLVHGPLDISTGSRIGILTDNGSICFYRDGQKLGTAFSGLSG